MYTILDFAPKQIFIAYIVFISASLLLYPLTKLILTTLEGVAEKWK